MERGTRATRTVGALLFVLACALFTTSCSSGHSSATTAPVGQTEQQSTPDDIGTNETLETEGSPVSPPSPAWPSPEEIAATLQPWLGEGSVSIDSEYSNDEARFYILPPGSFGADGWYEAGLAIWAYRYSDDRRLTWGGDNVEGGSTPEEVYASAIVGFRDVRGASGGSAFREYPEVAGGMVTNEINGMVLAGNGDYWYTVSITVVTGDAAFNDALVGVGRLLAE